MGSRFAMISQYYRNSILFEVFKVLDMISSECLFQFKVQALWKTAYKLTNQFAHPDFKGPMRAAVSIKTKLEKFKINMPQINALCNPGIKKRHWDLMNEKVRGQIKSVNKH